MKHGSNTHDDFEIASDVRTLAGAAEIKRDKPRMRRAAKKAREMIKDLERVKVA